jgi:hypothetical protein
MRSRRLPPLALLAAALAAPGLLCAEVVERVLASVDGRPVLLSETKAVEAVRGLERRPAIDALVDEMLMYREASRLPGALAPPDEEEKSLADLRERAPLIEQTVRLSDIRTLLRRQIVILRYVEIRFRPQVRIADETVREAYDAAYSGQADAPPFESAEAAIREELVRRDLDARIEAWVRELRAGAEIRYNP